MKELLPIGRVCLLGVADGGAGFMRSVCEDVGKDNTMGEGTGLALWRGVAVDVKVAGVGADVGGQKGLLGSRNSVSRSAMNLSKSCTLNSGVCEGT